MKINKFKINGEKKIKLKNFATDYTGNIETKEQGKKLLKKNRKKMRELQDMFYAFDKYSLLIIFQAMDAAGKDSSIEHVMMGVNPQGTQVFSFKQPSNEELDHGYLWRCMKALPERGRIGVFNRSYYEDVLVARVHNLIENQKIPKEFITPIIWEQRFEQIKNFEKYLYNNGTRIIKFFLNVSKAEQKNRFMKRLETPSKNWKFSASDLKERELWDEYQIAYQDAINETSTKYAPWYIIPADNKWYARLAISEIINNVLESLDIEYPKLDKEQIAKLNRYKTQLENEEDV
ncbi:MAG: polyphosphate--nucleotide phosphotransferase [Ignavibacteriae bacterium]|nr:MAG: polyphosphate--nucleotide phosphotransferase [Ignavibacteriota bacterium]